MPKTAIPQCWQCKKFIPNKAGRDGTCQEAASELRVAGYPIAVDAIPVRGDGDASHCAGEFDLSLQALQELAKEGFSVPYASDELHREWDAAVGDEFEEAV